MIEKKPFVRYNEEKTRDQVTIQLNPEERKLIDEFKAILEQPKDATVIKQLMTIGAKHMATDSVSYILATVFKNKAKNKRIGIVDYEL